MPSRKIVAEKRRTVVEIDIIRHNFFYFYNLRRNGQKIETAKRIDRERAEEIYNENLGQGKQRTINRVIFDDLRPCEWSWTVRLEVDDSSETT